MDIEDEIAEVYNDLNKTYLLSTIEAQENTIQLQKDTINKLKNEINKFKDEICFLRGLINPNLLKDFDKLIIKEN